MDDESRAEELDLSELPDSHHSLANQAGWYSWIVEAAISFFKRDFGPPVISLMVGVALYWVGTIPYAAMSETFSNCWKLSVMREAKSAACVVGMLVSVSSMAVRKSAKVGW